MSWGFSHGMMEVATLAGSELEGLELKPSTGSGFLCGIVMFALVRDEALGRRAGAYAQH